jgi:hypothetical protein
MNIQTLRTLLAENGGVLHSGQHAKGVCKVCVRELRCLALDLPKWTDLPDGNSPTDRACQVLNDADWSSDAARTKACLPLALLTESEAAEGWEQQYVLRTIREILPIALRADGLEDHAVACVSAEDLEAAGRAAKGAYNAAYYAYNASASLAAEYAAARYTAKAYNYAAKYAADDAAARYTADDDAYCAAKAAKAAEDPDALLRKSVQILIECHTGA